MITIALLGACTVDKNLSTGEDSSGTGSTGTSEPTGGDTTGTTGTIGTIGTTDATETTDGSGSTGAPQDPWALCAAQTDRAGCEALEFEPGDVSQYCLWMNWTPVTLADDVCTFGAEQGVCVRDFAGSEGCAGYMECGTFFGGAWKQDGDQVSLALAEFCLEPPQGTRCSVEFPDEEQAPECACLCDPKLLP